MNSGVKTHREAAESKETRGIFPIPCFLFFDRDFSLTSSWLPSAGRGTKFIK